MPVFAKRSTAAVLAVSLLAGPALTACQSAQNNPKQTVGTLGGAALGGLLGSQFGGSSGWTMAATGLGVLLGAAVGSELGRSLDETDRQQMRQASQQAYTAPVGQTINWNNPQSGNSGTITPIRSGQTNTGQYCRQFRTTVTIDGRLEEATGTACQQPDGTWQILS
ncbi:glycine zipper 2TM domain-containing protein [Roseospira marina]|uniref:Glycine zipper 2TM domain-containing protein n=1 Tax=Roseospira marina TaxID=140057 RepID=A0A5M6IEA5_9PROT|nr:RT0821/Lpp0805 family surface protein [Roseospira marina]KAA5606055.1 glycine zipper 2TM domain-containing protein [Roseospira marina]MBB4313083.1 surface antigen [Roseospira marina]MBB5086176.1 surface antigen [Roseospira marina]